MLGARARRTTLAFLRALLPAGQRFPAADEATLEKLTALLARMGRRTPAAYAALTALLDARARLSSGGRAFCELGDDRARELLRRLADGGGASRALLQALSAPAKLVHFDDPAVYDAIGCRWRFEIEADSPDWLGQVQKGDELEADQDIECDVVVVGSGAGGAPVALGLAERGHAVVLIEEGDFHRRDAFRGGCVDSFRRFARDGGRTGSIGNTLISIPMGQMVGGTTAINSGTCWRTPSRVLEGWADERGLVDLAPDRMAPYFERVERELQVEAASAPYLGGAAEVVIRGCERLGYSHRPLARNAPNCDGAGICVMGCPSGAKRSTDVSYVPDALQHGALLFTGVRAERVCMDGGRARGIEARCAASGRRLRVRAAATVLACGAFPTPAFLLHQGLGRGLRQLGRNLSIHPAVAVSARFEKEIRGWDAIPQGYCVDEFEREGILLEGASAPIELGAAQLDFVGDELIERMENYAHMATFGVMVSDRSRGRVRAGRDGKPRATYWLGRRERGQLQQGIASLARIFLAADALEVTPFVHGHRVLRGAADVAALASARLRARDLIVSAYHPLGTCRMATSGSQGVVSPRNEVFGIENLYITDGSAVPGSPAVNPQVTIMALATRAADKIAERLPD